MKEEKFFVREREGFCCFFCLSKDNLTFAHIFVWKKDGGMASRYNGICLCRDCHDMLDFMLNCDRELQIKLLRLAKDYLLHNYGEEQIERKVYEKTRKHV